MAIYTNRQPVNEVYFGDKSLDSMLKLLGEIRTRHMKKAKNMISKNINKDKDLNKLNKMFANKFGFKTFALDIMDYNAINAFTQPISYNYEVKDINKYIITDKNGFRYDKKAKFSCMVCVFSGLFLNPNFSDREVMAVILHEIGHNFQTVLDGDIKCITDATKAFKSGKFFTSNLFLDQLKSGNKEKLAKALAAKEEIKHPIRDMFKMFGYVGFELLNDISTFIVLPFSIYGQLIIATTQLMLNILFPKLKGPSLYKQEQIADSFATMYGYGNDLITALSKFEFTTARESRQVYNKVPLLPQLMQLGLMAPTLLYEVFEEHPTLTDRLVNQVDMLERELEKKDLDPDMEKQIRSDLDELKKVRDEYMKAKLDINDPYMYRKAYLELIYEVGGTTKYKISTDKNYFDDIDKAYEDNKK